MKLEATVLSFSEASFLLVSPLAPFDSIAKELLEVLKMRYPTGLSTTATSPDKIELPEDHLQIKFALPKSPIDLSQGWSLIETQEKDTPVDKGIKDNSLHHSGSSHSTVGA